MHACMHYKRSCSDSLENFPPFSSTYSLRVVIFVFHLLFFFLLSFSRIFIFAASPVDQLFLFKEALCAAVRSSAS